ncbi:hypothetical protein GCM10010320_26410 [Streptomyces caelestis]|uniref:Secreted trypsin-like serine protease n=1 Tax=Streptomyces caelestis TaxID=36816 RepID=A0A7W9LX83_9ACTN|nr:secreted trypsin-like serine protease [Streptomyces caelestis]GGW45175.1 hypothetical protein GCM10010320_26410 [Streptomyces caelestis]
MPTTPSGGRHRRRIRIALPVAAAGVAAVVAATLMTSSAGAATAVPTPTVKPAIGSPSLSALEKRIAGALAGDGTAGQTTEKSSLSSGTNTSSTDPKVIGGSETTLSSAPWMAQLWYHDDRDTTETGDDVSFFCGGAVVAPTKILTAAHCVRNDGRDYNWQAHGAVVTGTAQLPTTDSTGTTDLHGGQATAVLRQWWQWGYDPVDREVGRYESDLGMLTLAVPVKATPIRMVAHGDTASYAVGTQAKLYGWGRTSSTSQDLSQTLRTATLTLRSDSTCSGVYDTAFAAGRMVCAGTQSGSDTGTSAACNGDSGGPLVVGGRIAGVVSWGVEDCVDKGYYSVFTKMSAYAGSAYRQIDDTNLSTFNGRADGKADIFVRESSTKTGYEKDSNGSSFGARASSAQRLDRLQRLRRGRRRQRRRQRRLPGPHPRRHALPLQGHREGDHRDLRDTDLGRHRFPAVRHLGLKPQVSEAHLRFDDHAQCPSPHGVGTAADARGGEGLVQAADRLGGVGPAVIPDVPASHERARAPPGGTSMRSSPRAPARCRRTARSGR